MLKLLIFDLDDTLYDEETFVMSGFNFVSDYLSQKYKVNRLKIFQTLNKHFKQEGRDKVFNKSLLELNIKPTEVLVNRLIDIYRSHSPKIKTFGGVTVFLKKIRRQGIITVLVTDTRGPVQRRKIQALGLDNYFDQIICTDEHGLKKPDLKIYKNILQNFKTRGGQTICIGDDPQCDFVGAKKLGCCTIRIRQGRMKNLTLDKKHEADFEVKSFSEVTRVLLSKIARQ